MKSRIKTIILAFFCFLMLRITWPYLSFDDHTAFLQLKQWIIHDQVWKTAFYIHVISSCFCLLAGFTQFSKHLLHQHSIWHRRLGMLYVIVVLFLSGPSGLVMSVFANGGVYSQVAFVTLSVLWLYFTFMAFYAVKISKYEWHRQLMIRSYALTLSALTLRLWKLGIVMIFRPHPMDVYQWVAWLGWIPNLLLAEWYIRKENSLIKSIFK